MSEALGDGGGKLGRSMLPRYEGAKEEPKRASAMRKRQQRLPHSEKEPAGSRRYKMAGASVWEIVSFRGRENRARTLSLRRNRSRELSWRARPSRRLLRRWRERRDRAIRHF